MTIIFGEDANRGTFRGHFAVYNLWDETITELVQNDNVRSVAWSPDSEWIVFQGVVDPGAPRNGRIDSYQIRPDGTDLQQLEICL